MSDSLTDAVKGVALESAEVRAVSPPEITQAMIDAGARAIFELTGSSTAEPSGVFVGEMARAAYEAMVKASLKERP